MSTPIYGPLGSAPNGMDLTVSGAGPAFAGGQARTYSNFDTSMFSNIFWGPFNIQAAMDGAIDAVGETLVFDSISVDGLTAIWTGQTTIPLATGGTQTVYTRFVAEITGGSGAATWVDSTAPDPDITGGPAVLIDVDETANAFTVQLQYEASASPTGTFIPFLTFYDNAPTPPGNPPGTSGPALSSVDFGVYVQDNPATDGAPVFSGHDATVAYTEGDPAVSLAPTVTIFDSELSGLNNGLGNFNGASVSISGLGGDNDVEILSSPDFTLTGGGLADAGGNVFATFGAVGGLPSLVFTDANGAIPTTDLVNSVLQSIGYVNTSRTPNPTETMGLTFNDGTGNATPISITVNVTDVPNGDGIISDFVWNDGNQNGIQDVGEAGIEGVELTLATSADPSTTIATATSDANGAYQFDFLFAGDYLVGINPASLPADFVVTAANQGGDEALDNDFATTSSQVAVNLATDTSVVDNVDLGLFDSTNVAPVASNASENIDEDNDLLGQVTATDANSDPLTYSLVAGPSDGTLTFDPDGSYFYRPDQDHNGTDSFTFNASDGGLTSNTATVTINIAPVNDVPFLDDITFSTDEDVVFSGTLPIAVDPDGDPQDYFYDFGAQHGTVVVNLDGTFTYTPDADFFGTDTFNYHSNDGTRNSNLATANVTINAVNDPPVVTTNAGLSVDEGTTGVISSAELETTDPDAAAANLTYTLDTTVSNGTLFVDADTSGALDNGEVALGVGDTFTQADVDASHLTYIHDGSETTSDSFQFDVSDGTDSVDDQTFNITIDPVNDAPEFGLPGPGFVTTAIGSGDDFAYNVAVQADGAILLAGHSWNGTDRDFALVRYNIDGSLDTTFGSGGIVTTPIGASSDYGRSVAVQPNGAILVAGYTFNGMNEDLALVRYNSSGSLDTTFGVGGIVTAPVGSGDDRGFDVAVQSDGAILVAGYSSNGADQDFTLTRFTTDGMLDTTFGGGDGIVTTPIGVGDFGYNVAVQSDGAIIVSGYSFNGSNFDFALVRYTSAGNLDTTFGGGSGIVTTPIGAGDDRGFGLAVQPDGAIIVAGYSHNGSNNDFALVRYNSDGTPDPTFGGGDGIVTTPIGLSNDNSFSVTIQPNGAILVAGYSDNGSDLDFALVRYNSDGTLDATFGGGDGIVTTPVGSADDLGDTVAVQADGSILVGGYSFNGTDNDFALVRFNPDGTLDTTFDPVGVLGGTVSYTETGPAVVLDSDVVVSDAELDALNGGAGDYAGASLVIVRDTGFDTDDTFSFDTTGASFTVSGNNLQVGGLTFATFGGLFGPFTIDFNSSAAPATTALVNEVLQRIQYENTSGNPPASVQLNWTFDDGNSGAQGSGGTLNAIGSVTVDITPVNTPPFLAGDRDSEVNEGSSVTLSTVDLNAFDPDDPPTDVTFTITNEINGNVQLNGMNATMFTLQDVIDGDVSFRHDGSETTTASFFVSVEDGDEDGSPPVAQFFDIEVNPENDTPAIATNAGLSVDEGATGVISSAELETTDPDNAAADLVYTLDTTVTNGTLFVDADTSGALDNGEVALGIGGTFTQADLDANRLTYSHDGSETIADTFQFDVSDGTDSVDNQTFNIAVDPVNDPPSAVSITPVLTNLDENTDTSSGIKVGDIVVSDVDSGTNTLALIGTDASDFEIRNGTELFFIGATPDFETQSSYDVAVTVDDTSVGTTPDATSATFTLTINDVNEAPTAVSLTPVLSTLDENTDPRAGIKVADITVTDDALGDTIITPIGADAASFDVRNGNELFFVGWPNFEIQSSYSVAVSVDDAAIGTMPDATSSQINLTINDIAEALTPNDDRFSATNAPETLDGLAGNDILVAFGGDDVVFGNLGDDQFIYLDGKDEYDGQDGVDLADFSLFDAAVWIDLDYNPFYEAWTRDGPDLTPASGTYRPIASLENIENLSGSVFDDLVRGDAQDNTIFYTGGRDEYEGRGGTDIADFSLFDSAVWVDLDYVPFYEAWTRDGSDVASGTWRPIASVETIEDLTGTAFDDVLRGDLENNSIIGGAGDDNLTGRDGDDLFVFGLNFGSDIITDWQDDGPFDDVIDLSAIATITQFSDISGSIDYSTGSAVITTTEGIIELTGVASGLGDDDFVFIV